MRPKSRTSGPSVVLVVVSVAIIATLGFVSFTLPGNHSIETRNSTSVSGLSAAFYSAVSQGLQLQIRLNSTEIRIGGALTAQVSLLNTLESNLSLTPDFSADPKILMWDSHDSICSSSSTYHIIGYALYQGHYTSENLSKATDPLTLAPPGGFHCPYGLYGEEYIRTIDFPAKSYTATLSANASFSSVFPPQTIKMQANVTTGVCFSESYEAIITKTENGTTTTYTTTQYSFGCGSGSSLYGYYRDTSNCLPQLISNSTTIIQNNFPCFHSFSAGAYTIVAEDLWNQTDYAYLQVAA